ncbi:MAG: hypothetical protein RLZZ528_2218 [Pseudomonadota bacterium]
MPKPTFTMIAAAAGVGTATVERVLNGRGGVRPGTALKVIRAARALDWPGRLPEAHRGILRIEVMLVRPETSFFARLAAAYRRIAATLDRSVQLHITFMDEADPAAIARRIARPEVSRAGLILAAPAHPDVQAALGAAAGAGCPVVQVVTRVLPEAEFVAINNYAAGRTAAHFLSRMCDRPGPVLALCHSAPYHVHRERLRGFSDCLAAQGRHTLVFAAFANDDRDLAARRLRETLRDWPDLAGVYNVCAANGAILDVLAKCRQHVFFVGHELSQATEDALRAGVADIVIDQAPETQARRTIDIMLSRLGLTEMQIDNPPVRFLTITGENL